MVAASADEQTLRGEDRSHAQEVAKERASELGATARGGAYPAEPQPGPSNPRPVGGSRAGGGGEEGAGLPPTRKRRHDVGVGGEGARIETPSYAAVAQSATSSGAPLEHRKTMGGATASESWSAGREALHRLGSLYMARPRGPDAPVKKGGPLYKDTRAVESFQQAEDAFDRLRDLVEGKQATKRVRELEQQLGSLRREIGDLRIELLRLRGARDGGRGSRAASVSSRAASPAGRPEVQVSVPKGAGRGEWVWVGRGGKPARQGGQRVQLLGGVVNPPPGLAPAAPARQGGAAKGGPPKRQGGHAVSEAPKRQKAAAAGGRQQSKRSGRPRLPRNPAVLVTAVGELSYASILREAQEKVDLADIGIDVGAAKGGLLIKRARNGGYLFEVPGEGGAAKADRLARELGEVLVGAKVARPVKLAEVRITGLVDGISTDMVVTAFRRCGECSQDDLVAGEIRRAPGGLGTMWLRCPLTAAIKVEAQKGLRLGWAHLGVQLLEARPLQCYRCLKFGHLAAACTGPEDRKGRCFRCGGGGHLARGCNADPRCLLCEKAGFDPVHRLGGKACPAARAAWEKQRGGQPVVERPVGTRGRRRSGNKAKGRATPAPAGGAVGPGAVFRAPEHPAPRKGRKEEGAEARAPLALERAEAPLVEAGGVEPDDVDVVSCAQPLSGCEETLARMEIAGEEEELADSSSYLPDCGLDEWLDSPPPGDV